MIISYKKLWKLLIDRDMKKKDLQKLAGISSASITKLGKNENVNTDILQKICSALECDISDIMEMVLDKQEVTIKENPVSQGITPIGTFTEPRGSRYGAKNKKQMSIWISASCPFIKKFHQGRG